MGWLSCALFVLPSWAPPADVGSPSGLEPKESSESCLMLSLLSMDIVSAMSSEFETLQPVGSERLEQREGGGKNEVGREETAQQRSVAGARWVGSENAQPAEIDKKQ